MAPRPTYDSPHTQLLRLATIARRRGLSFEEFWSEAVREGKPLVMTNHPKPPEHCVRWPTDRNDRLSWAQAIADTKDGWRRTYERIEPLPRERAVAVLGDSIGVLERLQARELGDGIDAREDVLSAA